MTIRPLMAAMLLCGVVSAAGAATPKEAYAADTKHAAERYASDKKLCAEEQSSGARMQCLRDAKAENDKAVAAAKATLAAAGPAAAPGKAVACHDCGKVTSVHVGEKAGESGAVGLIAGGVAGALLGNQVGSGRGRDIATVARAAGGAYAGKKIEEKANSTKVWTVHVQYDNGNKAQFNFDKDPGMKAGDKVRNNGKSITRH
jgi:outer membrane lipoprotein SlyB